ncbi:DoxX family protein [Siculibacillus lacustris]|uniref:DoxX family protein n=1 Tax=Siculibacillus lacustris TaxID=1549641 RepID=A0A4Q9VN35_9HYPH|nr:DoxX family protein [Siculibacillus lacustris]TBW37035.1 DoxX family protein [Siculibacillus lacustris]
MTLTETLNPQAPKALAALRIVTALVFLAHGTAKFFAFPHVAMFDGMPVFSLYGLAGVLELAGGLLLLVGLFTRPTAFVLAGFMAVAYFMAHAPKSFFPIINGGDSAIQFCFVFLYLVFAGAGAWSLDAKRGA